MHRLDELAVSAAELVTALEMLEDQAHESIAITTEIDGKEVILLGSKAADRIHFLLSEAVRRAKLINEEIGR